MTDHHVITASRIRAERERLGLTRTEMARQMDVRREAYNQIETRANPTLATLIKLVEVGCRIEAIAPELCGQKGGQKAGQKAGQETGQ